MNLVSFSVSNYRSLTTAHRLPIGDKTILVGPNNEGKSNILQALVVALTYLHDFRDVTLIKGRARGLPMRFDDDREREYFVYRWERDFPIHLQAKKPKVETILKLEFDLTEAEIGEFRTDVGSKLNGTLPIQIALGRKEPGFKVMKQGRGGKVLSRKAEQIARFIGRRLDFEYVGAIRTASRSRDIVRSLVDRELRELESDPAYQEALKQVAELQKPALQTLSRSLLEALREFLPDVRDVSVSVAKEARVRALRHTRIVVDDGTPTDLSRKGDGVQSLAALSLMRHVSESSAGDRSLILAIEEPESHLHPNAIHRLREVLDEVATRHQIIATTHSPLLIDREHIGANVLVTESKAKPAKRVSDIRDILGVRASDNLRNAELVLFVEGEHDRTAITAILSHRSSSLRNALKEGRLAVDSLVGSNNLSYKVALARDSLCKSFAFLDDDKAGTDSGTRATTEGLLLPAEIVYSVCPGKTESEIEDLYDSQVYADWVRGHYGVTLGVASFRAKQKWSDRMRETFRAQGKQWDKRVEKHVKAEIADRVAADPLNALLPATESSIRSLQEALEERLAVRAS